MKLPRVPDRITSPIRKICNIIGSSEKPRYIEVSVAPDAVVNDCFINVANKISRDGGDVQYGWAIWYLPGVLMEAEFHAVWCSPEGVLIDISPRPIKFDKILFVPDPARVYEGQQVNNIRIPLKKDENVREFIQLHEKLFRIMNEGELANKHGEIEFPRETMEPIIRRLSELKGILDI